MSPSQIIVLATPVFLLLIAIEFAVGLARRNNTYRLADAINSIGLGMLSQISAVFTRVLRVGIYTAVYSTVAIGPGPEFWQTGVGWLLALVFYDFCYYWLHRAGHEVSVFWAAHVVHHQSEDYNLSTALRQTSSGALLGWIFYLPMAVAGVPPLVFGVVALVDLLYQYWVHTEQVGKLGWFDRWFCSPSNHRVHHAVNDQYLDRNYGGILIIWDRLFGSFEEEGERCVYGTRKQLASWNPLWANAEVYARLVRDSWHTRNWGDKLRVWLKPPGWRPADVAARWPDASFDITRIQRFDPPVRGAMQWVAGLQFVLLLAGVVGFLWHADTMPRATAAIWFVVLCTVLWGIGMLLEGRFGLLELVLVESAALSVATSALGMVELHRIFKPLALAIAILFVAKNGRSVLATGTFFSKSDVWLLLALVGSLVGDVFLMFPGFFIQGLVAFLLAHLCFIVRFREGDTPGAQRLVWFPDRRALLLVAVVGVGMYTFLWQGGLPQGLRLPVAAYVLAIGAMTAQAWGRSRAIGTPEARWVAWGASFFMLSDALLATNRFVSPVPWSAVWVLGTYYLAQILIARGCVAGRWPR